MITFDLFSSTKFLFFVEEVLQISCFVAVRINYQFRLNIFLLDKTVSLQTPCSVVIS